jgi:iron(III) transport system substrate-binding protein
LDDAHAWKNEMRVDTQIARRYSALEDIEGATMHQQSSIAVWKLLTAAVCAALCVGGASAREQTTPAPMLLAQAGGTRPAPALDALIKAAKGEGEMTFYSAATENVAKRAAEAFSSKYGIKSGFIRLSSVPLLRRYASEAEAGNFAADVLIAAAAEAFVADSVKKGWTEPLSQAGIPALTSGEFPAKFNRGNSAIIGVQPWLIFYSTDKVKGADVPRDWPDLLNPKWKGQVILADPRTSDAYIDLWTMFLDRYGEPFFAGLRAQGLRTHAGGPAAIQALAAGEGSVGLPNVGAAVEATREKGAPLGTVTPAYTTGVELQISLTTRSKAKHPNAGRLFAHYVMTVEGNKVFNSDPGSLSVFDTSALPREYESPKPGAIARKEVIYKLLGL